MAGFQANSPAFADMNPSEFNGGVDMREWSDVPVMLRNYARTVLPRVPVSGWWTVGEFRESDNGGQSGEFVSVVARRIPGGAVAYGVERD